MSVKYRYGHKPGKRRSTRALIFLVISFGILGAIAFVIYKDIKSNSEGQTEGKSTTVIQSFGTDPQKLSINEPTYTMDLPRDWKEIKRTKNTKENSVTWQAGLKNEDNRFLTVYVDLIPVDKAINRLLPLTVSGRSILPGNVSENCASFTKGGTFNAAEMVKKPETPAKWEGVDFICNLPRALDNEIGAAEAGKINQVVVEGPEEGSHRYFFVFTDRNIQPDYTIFYDALRSFRAK